MVRVCGGLRGFLSARGMIYGTSVASCHLEYYEMWKSLLLYPKS
jgi:hypothetical protein